MLLRMDSTERAELIRKGNAAFNAGDYTAARELFTKAAYASGLIRIGDHYMYDRRLPLLAYGYYKRAGARDKIDDLHRRMVGALGTWLGRDKLKQEPAALLFPSATSPQDSEGMIAVPVNALLRETALKILSR